MKSIVVCGTIAVIQWLVPSEQARRAADWGVEKVGDGGAAGLAAGEGGTLQCHSCLRWLDMQAHAQVVPALKVCNSEARV